jgi:hypothetical protein
MRDSPDGALCMQDELAGWFGSMDKYSGGKGGDRGFWLQAYNGGSYHVQRIARGFVKIDNLSISLVGGIQPDPIRKISADSVDDGLVQRILPVILKPSVKSRDEPESPAIFEYSAMIGRLRHLDGVVLRFDDGAQVYRQELEDTYRFRSARRLTPSLRHTSANTRHLCPAVHSFSLCRARHDGKGATCHFGGHGEASRRVPA